MVQCNLVRCMDLIICFSDVNGLTSKVIVMQINERLYFSEVNGLAFIF